MPASEPTSETATVGGRPRTVSPAGQASEQDKTVGTVSRVVRVLTAVADAAGPVSVGDLAESVRLPVSTVHRLLNLLAKEGFVHLDPVTHRYSVGSEFYRLSGRVVAKTEVTALAQPLLRRVAARFNETVLLALHMPEQRSMMFVARADGSQVLQYRIELFRPLSLVWGASGRAILAFLDEETIQQTIDVEGPGPVSGKPVPPQEEILAELAQIQALGYAVSEEEKLPGARGIAVPIFNARGAIGGMCLTSPKERVPHGSIEEIAMDLVEAAGELSRLLGATVASK